MINLSKTTKFQITLIVIIVFIYVYRSELKHSRFEDDIPSDVNQCVDQKLVQLLSSPQTDFQVVDLALKKCDSEVTEWLKSYTSNEDEYGMTYSYLRDYYISQIKYSRQPEASGKNHS